MKIVSPQFPISRPRRLRGSKNIRRLVRETTLAISDLIWPLFICEGTNKRKKINSMPGVCRLSIDEALKDIGRYHKLGLPAVALFPCVPEEDKSADCKNAWDPENLANRATRAIKEAFPDLLVMLDVALDPYNIYGQDGLVKDEIVLNDETLDCLGKQALGHASAGADILGPSDMMDGRIGYIRSNLENNNFKDKIILSYSAKFSSSFYSGFRDAVGSGKLLKGDKKTYQLDIANSDEALRMVKRDLEEGADMVMVKPGLPYLDICRQVKDTFNVPVFAYQVSGEYSMIQNAIIQGLAPAEETIFETMLSFKRAGCSGVLTYFAPFLVEYLSGSKEY